MVRIQGHINGGRRFTGNLRWTGSPLKVTSPDLPIETQHITPIGRLCNRAPAARPSTASKPLVVAFRNASVPKRKIRRPSGGHSGLLTSTTARRVLRAHPTCFAILAARSMTHTGYCRDVWQVFLALGDNVRSSKRTCSPTLAGACAIPVSVFGWSSTLPLGGNGMSEVALNAPFAEQGVRGPSSAPQRRGRGGFAMAAIRRRTTAEIGPGARSCTVGATPLIPRRIGVGATALHQGTRRPRRIRSVLDLLRDSAEKSTVTFGTLWGGADRASSPCRRT